MKYGQLSKRKLSLIELRILLTANINPHFAASSRRCRRRRPMKISKVVLKSLTWWQR